MKDHAISTPTRVGDFWKLKLNWKRVGRIVIMPVTPIFIAIVVPMVMGWFPVMGRSMQPTFPAVGGYFRTEEVRDPRTQLEVNDIVVLRGQTLGYSVKRVAKIDPQKGLFVLGDNRDKSEDSSFGIDLVDNHRRVYIPFDEVVGRARAIWSITRPFGGWWNWALLRWSANDVHACPYSRYVAIQKGTSVSVYLPPSQKPKFTANGRFRRWNGKRFELITDQPVTLLSVEVDGSSEKISNVPRQTGIVPSSANTLAFDGFAEVNVGDTITLIKRGLTVKVMNIKYIQCGNMFGIATIIGIDKTLDPVPTMPEPVSTSATKNKRRSQPTRERRFFCAFLC